jgi:hypothetical protein
MNFQLNKTENLLVLFPGKNPISQLLSQGLHNRRRLRCAHLVEHGYVSVHCQETMGV